MKASEMKKERLNAENAESAGYAEETFAGISLEGSTLRPDGEANRKLYGKSANAAEIISESDANAPSAAHDLIAALQQASPQLKR
jgi:lipid-binding SYLF domain-containing protein